MGTPVLSVVIVTFNSAADIGVCLESIFQHAPSCEFEVIVVDNGSQDATVSILRNQEPRIRLVIAPDNRGFAAGNCLGADEARGDMLLLLNPDTVVLPGALDALVETLRADDDRWVAGACLVTPEGEPNSSWGDFPTVGWAILEMAPWRRLGLPVRSSRQLSRTCSGIDAPMSVDWVSGAAFLVRRSAWDRLGGLYTGYFLYFEETDFCFRVHAQGGDVVIAPGARIVHVEGASIGRQSARQRIWSAQSLILFIRRNRGAAAAFVVRAWIALVNLVLLGAATVMAPFSATARRNRPRYRAFVALACGAKLPHPAGG